MPIWLRKFHIQSINEHIKKENEKIEKAKGQSQMGDGKIARPNINPSSTYNF